MKIEKKVYTTRNEKGKDFGIGFGLQFLLMFGLNFGVTTFLSPLLGTFIGSTSDATVAYTSIGILLLIINLVILIFFVYLRKWVALGMLSGFGAVFLSGLCLAASCYSLINFLEG